MPCLPILSYFKPKFLALLKALYALYCWSNTSELFLGNPNERKNITKVSFLWTISITQLLEVSVQVSLHLRLEIGNTVVSAIYHIKANMTKINTSSLKRAERWTNCPCFILITSYSRALESLHLKVDRAGMSRCICVHAHTCWKSELLWIRVRLLSDTMTGTHAAGKRKTKVG